MSSSSSFLLQFLRIYQDYHYLCLKYGQNRTYGNYLFLWHVQANIRSISLGSQVCLVLHFQQPEHSSRYAVFAAPFTGTMYKTSWPRRNPKATIDVDLYVLVIHLNTRVWAWPNTDLTVFSCTLGHQTTTSCSHLGLRIAVYKQAIISDLSLQIGTNSRVWFPIHIVSQK